MSEPLVVIGNGMAAAPAGAGNCGGLGRYAVAIIGDEPRLAYNRVLSSVLAGEIASQEIELQPAAGWVAQPRRDVERPRGKVDLQCRRVVFGGQP